MENNKYLFQVEAVNMGQTVYDSADISTIRGGGFYLLHRIELLPGILEKDETFQKMIIREKTPADASVNGADADESKSNVLTEGASKVVFRFHLKEDTPETLKNHILKKLYDETAIDKETFIKEAMFLVDYVDETDAFQNDLAKLMGRIRVQQMQSPSVRIFKESLECGTNDQGKPLNDFDVLNRVLPAGHEDVHKGMISDFTYKRRESGKNLRKKIYGKILVHQNVYPIEKEVLEDNEGRFPDWEFTDTLEELSDDRKQGNLSRKIAYIYLDGNKFGKLQSKMEEDELKEFDKKIKGFKAYFMGRLFKLAKNNAAFMTHENKMRLETLLWGGDEIAFIVPAWMGWTVALEFFDALTEYQYDDGQKGMTLEHDNGKALTFAMGLVFAHHKNPIRNLNHTANDIAESVKKTLGKKEIHDRDKGDLANCVVLESLEVLPKSYNDYVKDIYETDPVNLPMSRATMPALRQVAQAVSKGFSRGKLYDIATAWKETQNGDAVKKVVQRGLETSGLEDKEKNEFMELMSSVTGFDINHKNGFPEGENHGYRFLQLAELYDYLIPKGEQI